MISVLNGMSEQSSVVYSTMVYVYSGHAEGLMLVAGKDSPVRLKGAQVYTRTSLIELCITMIVL